MAFFCSHACAIEKIVVTLRGETPKGFADIIKSVYWRLFWLPETWKLSIYPKQEGSKRPLGYDYPARRASFVGLLCLVAFHIRRGRCLHILVSRVIPEPRYGE